MLVSPLHPMEEGKKAPKESPRGTTWEPAAGCVKEGEHILSSQLYHITLAWRWLPSRTK